MTSYLYNDENSSERYITDLYFSTTSNCLAARLSDGSLIFLTARETAARDRHLLNHAIAVAAVNTVFTTTKQGAK